MKKTDPRRLPFRIDSRFKVCFSPGGFEDKQNNPPYLMFKSGCQWVTETLPHSPAVEGRWGRTPAPCAARRRKGQEGELLRRGAGAPAPERLRAEYLQAESTPARPPVHLQPGFSISVHLPSRPSITVCSLNSADMPSLRLSRKYRVGLPPRGRSHILCESYTH